MSFQSFVTERLSAITEMLNAYNTNAKTIAELPAQNTLDPSSLIHVSRGGVSEKLAIQKIIDSILSYQFNKLISISGDITVLGNTVTVPAAAWVMDNVNYHTNSSTDLNAPFAETGYTRTDIIVADKFNTIYRVAGPETQGVSPAPNQPIDTVYITKIEVTDSSLANPEPPFIGEEFKLKSESGDLIVNYPDAVIEQILLPDNRNSLSLTGVVTDIKSTQVAIEFIYSGKSHFVKNKSGRTVTIWHNAGTGNVKYSFPNSLNYQIRSGEILEFVMNSTDSNNLKNEFVGSIFDLGLLISSATEKLTVNDNDRTGIADSEDSNKTKYWKFSTIKSTLKTYFDGLYLGIANDQTVSGIKTFLSGKFGLRNNANTFTSFFSNTNTASRTYTLQNRNGTLLDDTDLTTINASINAKQGSFVGSTNYIPKSISPTAMAPSRIRDTGSAIGIGTVLNPLKDLSLGRGSSREIGVENSDNSSNGTDLIISAGQTVNTSSGTFDPLSQTNRRWGQMSTAPNGDIYVSSVAGNIYKRVLGVGNFVDTGQASGSGLTVDISGNVYKSVNNGSIFKQIGGTGSFTNLSQTSRAWNAMAASQVNNDVYVVVTGGDIYMQTAGTGNFIALGQTSRQWLALACHPNGNVYAGVYNGDIYRQTGGTGNFVALGQTANYWTGLYCAPSGNVYACTNTGDIYVQTGGTGNFVAMGQTLRDWNGISADANNNVYACVGYSVAGDVYLLTNGAGSSNLKGGTLKLKSGLAKGNSQSRIELYTSQKTTSGTNMQLDTLRAYLDENGYMIWVSMPIYVNNAAALSAGLLQGTQYQTATGEMRIVV